MKYLKKFNENSREKITFEDAKKWILSNYSDSKICEMFDEEVASGNWIDRDQMEEEEYESEHDYYTDYGHGEAESAVMDDIINDLKSRFELDFDTIGDETNIYDFLKEEFDSLN